MSLLRASLLGGVDGCITSFAIVAGVHAAKLSSGTLWVVGSSSVLADGLSMGVSEFLSSYSSMDGDRRTLRAARLGAACFALFITCGFVPLLVYVLARRGIVACVMFSLVELMLLGAGRTMASGEPILFGLLQTTLLGTVAGAVAYGVGSAVHRIV